MRHTVIVSFEVEEENWEQASDKISRMFLPSSAWVGASVHPQGSQVVEAVSSTPLTGVASELAELEELAKSIIRRAQEIEQEALYLHPGLRQEADIQDVQAPANKPAEETVCTHPSLQVGDDNVPVCMQCGATVGMFKTGMDKQERVLLSNLLDAIDATLADDTPAGKYSSDFYNHLDALFGMSTEYIRGTSDYIRLFIRVDECN